MGRFFKHNRTKKLIWVRYCLVVVWLAILIVYHAVPVQASVTLTYFTAEAFIGMVRLRWGTASELQNAGFYIQRSNLEFGTYETISPFIASTGDDLVGAEYSYDDSTVTNGQTYWYRLEAIDLGQNSNYEGLVHATPGELPTVTPTPTATLTMTRTPTTTQSQESQGTSTPTTTTTTSASISGTPSPTSNPTISPTQPPADLLSTATRTVQAAYPAPATTVPPEANPSGTPVVAIVPDQPATPSPIPSLTLIPLPRITFILPEPDNIIDSVTPEVTDQPENISDWFTPQRMVLISIIALIWVILGGWVLFAIRRLG
jgi:hypothetical protein